MQITDYIATLLYRYECVVIPGFGAFLTQRQSAQIDGETHVFFPPKKTVSFNRQLKENDGLLANYIAKTEGISYEQSFQKINSFIENITETLETTEKVNLPQIGMFYQQDEKILFQPAGDINYLPEAFGTSSFSSSKIARTTTTSSAKKNEPVILKPAAVAATNKITASKEKKNRSAYWRYAAVGIVAIGLGGFITANWYSSQVTSHNIAAQEQAEKQIETKIQQATFSIEDPLPSVTFKVNAKRGKYHLVAGAFRSKENAEVKLQELQNGEFHPAYIGENKFGLHQVVYDSFEERKEALKALNTIRKSENSSAWLLVKEL